MEPRIVTGDLLDQPVEAIVNPWNRNIIPWFLLLPHGVSGAIKKRAGLAPFWEIGKFGPIPLGEARWTSAGRLPFKGIIHVTGIDGFWRGSEKATRSSVQSAMTLAESRAVQSLAFPIIGSGAGGFPVERAEAIMLETLAQIESDIQVLVVRYGRPGKE